MLIDGNALATGILASLKHRIQEQNLKPVLIDVVLEDDVLQLQYARVKKRAAEQIGVHCQLKVLPKTTTTEAIREELQGLNVLGLPLEKTNIYSNAGSYLLLDCGSVLLLHIIVSCKKKPHCSTKKIDCLNDVKVSLPFTVASFITQTNTPPSLVTLYNSFAISSNGNE